MNENLLKEIIFEQRKQFKTVQKKLVKREKLDALKKYLKLPHIIIITGIRRCGKSTLLKEIAGEFYGDDYYYISFEDERLLNFRVEDFNRLYEVLYQMYGKKSVFLIDEIQIVDKWENFIRRFYEKNIKMIITGSNASLLSGDLGIKLTGRYQKVELFPFCFKEYLAYFNISFEKDDVVQTETRAGLKKYFNAYYKTGGMPEHLKYQENDILKILYEDVLYRDIAARHGINEIRALRELAFFLVGNISHHISFNKIKEYLKLGSVNTVKKYCEYLEDSYLLFTINKFAYSIKQQLIASKKVYCIDNGIIETVAFQFSKNRGSFLENIVFLELKRHQKDIYYYITKSGKEVDFLIKLGAHDFELIQVCLDMADENTKKREISALTEACDELKVNQGLIITENDKDSIKVENIEITVMPCYEWLLFT